MGHPGFVVVQTAEIYRIGDPPFVTQADGLGWDGVAPLALWIEAAWLL